MDNDRTKSDTPSDAGPEPLPKAYDPAAVEERIYRAWGEGGYFHAEADAPGRPFTIVIPPPNVTDRLHLGHALNNTLQDILVRWRRMQGHKTLWLPGTDHAGIATQAVVERRMFEQEGKTRHDVGRDELVKRIWAWRERSGDLILEQLRRIGSSCDWQRTRFTLDETCARAVRTAFYRMFCDGLVYRGLRLVNWDTHLQTAVADDEVYHEKVKGHLWHIKYPIKGRPGKFVTVATTRPETMLGDTAVAVHPKDTRYESLIGGSVILPLLEREIPVIADGILVDPEFGSGCVKVTPAHDPNDYEVGLRHDLEMINILMPDGRINASGGPYEGLDRFEARKKVVADLEAQGLLEKIEPYETDVGHSDRSKTPIEPYLSEQWFVKMADLAEAAMEAVRDGRVRFHPERYARTYLDWLSQKRDWCISRQLWWGHRIPIWSRDLELPADVAPEPAPERGRDAQVCAALDRAVGGQPFGEYLTGAGEYFLRTEKHPDEEGWIRTYVCPKEENAELADRLEKAGWQRDPDVLDTWFSSALWPFSTLGWPEKTADLEAFYPTDVLITAREIITLWVARMVMMGLYNLGDVPFHDVYIHAMIQDGTGRPMKKSLGNGVDPLEIIATHGADAQRFTLAWMTTETQDVRLPVEVDPETGHNTSPKFDMGRNFCNKIWNAVRFALMNLDGAGAATFDASAMQLEDKWILSRTERIARKVTEELEAFHFQASLTVLYDFFWHDLCDWYLEVIKPRMADAATRAVPQRVLAFVLDRTLRLLHPFVPFITEAAWEGLIATVPDRSLTDLAEAPASERLIVAAWPEPSDALIDEEAERAFEDKSQLLQAAREAKGQAGQSAAAVDVFLNPEAKSSEGFAASTFSEYGSVAGVSDFHFFEKAGPNQPGVYTYPAGSDMAGTTVSSLTCASSAYVPSIQGPVFVPMPEELIKRERERTANDIEAKKRFLAGIEKKLANPNFVEKAPAEVVERERARADEARAALADLEKRQAELG